MTDKFDISNEELLLLELCRLEFPAGSKGRIRELLRSVSDWDRFVTSATNHGLSALVCYNIGHLSLSGELPVKTWSLLRKTLMLNIYRNSFFSKSLSSAISILNKAKIKTVLLKGIAMEITAYGNKGIRQMTDTDLLVLPDKCMKAWNILKKNGFIPLPVKSILYKPILPYIGKHLPSLYRDGISIELHHDLFGIRRSSLSRQLFESSNGAMLNCIKVNIPQPQIFFLYLVRHLHSHETRNESQLRLYTDLNVLLEKHKEEIINEKLTGLAEEAGMKEILASRLMILRDVWDTRFPDAVNTFIDEYCDGKFMDKFFFFLKSPKGTPPVTDPLTYYQTIKDIPGFHRKALYLLGDLFPTVSFMKKRYNCSNIILVLLYYPHRFGKILHYYRGMKHFCHMKQLSEEER